MNLNKIIKIYLPGTKNVNEKLTASQIKTERDQVAGKLSHLFGGATCQKVNGFYISDNGELINENITIVYAFTDRAGLKKNKNAVLSICQYLKTKYNQESISLELNNKLYFI